MHAAGTWDLGLGHMQYAVCRPDPAVFVMYTLNAERVSLTISYSVCPGRGLPLPVRLALPFPIPPLVRASSFRFAYLFSAGDI